MDDFEITIDGSSQETQRPSSEMPQINPRVAVAAVAVFVLALAMWLGSQTPTRTPVESSTTTTVASTTSAETSQGRTGPRLTPGSLSDLVEVSRLLISLGLEGPSYVLITGQVYGSVLVRFDSGGFSLQNLSCVGAPVEVLLGEVEGDLIGANSVSACRFGSNNGGEAVARYTSLELLQEDVAQTTLRWFCDDGQVTLWLEAKIYEASREDIAMGPIAEPLCGSNEATTFANAADSVVVVSPGEQYALVLPKVGSFTPSSSVTPKLLDLSSGETIQLEYSGDERFGPWISDESFLVRSVASSDSRFSFSNSNSLPPTRSVSIESALDGERDLLLDFEEWDILPRVQVVVLGGSDG